ncbi:MAG TPA: tetratricopeptide repeat protein [Phycisphaerales bacterium]|nr:tetratricopeptide repeat protein [Phycisphaerales bacterium]
MPSIAQLEKLLQADPQDAFVLYGLAQEYAKCGQIDRAVEHYDRCLLADPMYLYAYYHKARALQQGSRIDDALATVTAGINKAKEAQDAHALAELQTLMDELA